MAIKQTNMPKDDEATFDFERFFDNVINKGGVTKTVEVTDGLSVELRPLNAQEQLLAELTILANEETVPQDTINRITVLQMLSRSIVSVNSVEIGKDDKEARAALHAKISSLAGVLIDKMFKAYKELMKEQATIYGEDLVENIGNF